MSKSKYEQALEGKHPDIRYPEKWKKHPNEPANRAINLYLRDIFTALSLEFCEKVKQTDPKIFEQIQKQTIIHHTVYTDSIFDDIFTPFIEHEKELSEIKEAQEILSKEGLWHEFFHNYNVLSMDAKVYFKELLAHTKYVATLKRYDMDKLVIGKYKEYYWSPTKDFSLTTSHGVDTTLVPVCSYGKNCVLKMLYTTNILIYLSEKLLLDSSNNTEEKYWDIVITETARGQEKEKAIDYLKARDFCVEEKNKQHCREYIVAQKESERISVLDSVKEAIHSIQATVSSCVAEKIDVFHSFEEHLYAIVKSRLPLQFAKILPFGYTLPVVRRGRYFVNMVEKPRFREEKLEFSNHFKKCADFFKEDYLKNRVYCSGERTPGLLGFGCPAAIKKKEYQKTGIEYILEAYMHVFENLER